MNQETIKVGKITYNIANGICSLTCLTVEWQQWPLLSDQI